MDAFNALWNNPEQRRRPPDDDFQLFTMEEWFSKSSTHKILNGSFRCPLPSELEQQPKKTERQNERGNSTSSSNTPGCNGQNSNNSQNQPNQRKNNTKSEDTKVYVPGLLKVPVIDRVSDLSRDEQKDCLRLFQKFDGKPVEGLTPSEKAEYQLFQSLFRRVQAEQKEFLEHAKKDWLDYADRTCKLKGDPYNFVLQHWKDKVTHAMAQYPRNYKLFRKVSLLHEGSEVVQMHLIKNILNIGKVPIAKLPQFDAPFRTATTLIRLRTWRHLNVPPAQLSGTLHRVPVSRDPNAERLARLHGANIVMSTSAFKCLLDNHDESKHPHHSGVGKSWIIPVIIKEHRSFCDGKPIIKTTVFLDKTLPLPKMTKFEKVCTWQKHGLLAAVIHRHHDGGVEFEVKGDDIMIRKECQIPNKANSSVTNDKQVLSDKKQNDKIVSDPLKPKDDQKPPEIPIEIKKSENSCSNLSEEDDDDSSDEFTLTIALSDEESKIKNTSTIRPLSESFIPSQDQTVNKSNSELRTETKFNDFQAVEGSTINTLKALELKQKETQENSVVCPSGKSTTSSQNEDVNDSNTKLVAQIKNDGSQAVKKSEDTHNLLESKSNLSLPTSVKSDVTSRWENTPAPPPVKTVNGNALPPSTTNVVYNLWSLQAENEHSLENRSESINVLIRSHIDGCEMLGSGAYAHLSIAVKPEYQLEYGAGVIPLSDLTRQWAKLLIQPDCSLARVRVNIKTTEMVKVEKCSKEEIAAEAKLLYDEDLNHTLMSLKGILSDLMTLPAGEYLLSHAPDMGHTAQLFRTTKGDEDVDWYLHGGYGAIPGEIGSDVPWQPLDPRVIMPKNLLFDNMPCTFQCRWAPVIKHKLNKPPKFATAQNLKPKKKKKNKKKGKQ